MITVITGTPGAGKTLYTVTQLVQAMVGTTTKNVNAAGETIEVPRTVFTNINGLQLDHELIDGGGRWVRTERKGEEPLVEFVGASGGLRDWHKWAKPGSLIVFDEVQKVWEPRANGAWVPPDIQALETHRHMGVDFIIITQGLMLTDRNLLMLCNRHLHVRRVANMPFAVVYEWDHASRQLMYSRALTNKKWFYPKKGYQLYKSAEVHTKQPRSIPKALFAALGGVVLLAMLGPFFYTRLGERFGWIEAPKAQVEAKKPPVDPGKPLPDASKGGALPVDEAKREKPKFAGCVASKARCTCFDDGGQPVDKGPGFCDISVGRLDGPPVSLDKLRIPDQERHQLELVAMQREDTELFAVAAAHAEAQRGLHALPEAPPQLQNKSPERSAGGASVSAR